MSEEKHRQHDNDDTDQLELQVVEVAEVKPLRQIEIGADEKLIEAEADHQQHGAEQEQIDDLDELERHRLRTLAADLGLLDGSHDHDNGLGKAVYIKRQRRGQGTDHGGHDQVTAGVEYQSQHRLGGAGTAPALEAAAACRDRRRAVKCSARRSRCDAMRGSTLPARSPLGSTTG